MTGLLIFLLLGVVLMLALWFAGRLRGEEALLTLAALFVAAAGYTWQGSPGLAGAPAQGQERAGLKADTLYMVERGKLLHVYGEPAQWLVLADGFNRAGDDLGAAQVLAGAVKRAPRDAALRIGYAHALLTVADYNYTPAVALAFARAEAIDASDPAPRYFEGLARFESGDPVAAAATWRALQRTLPPRSDWRKVLDDRLGLVDLLMARMPRR